jgi:hypothetical protein
MHPPEKSTAFPVWKGADKHPQEVLIALLLAVLLHVLLIPFVQIVAEHFEGVHAEASAVAVKNRVQELEVMLEMPMTADQYVETNPSAADQAPDQTDAFSNKNQQSAQAIAAKELSPDHTPEVKGDEHSGLSLLASQTAAQVAETWELSQQLSAHGITATTGKQGQSDKQMEDSQELNLLPVPALNPASVKVDIEALDGEGISSLQTLIDQPTENESKEKVIPLTMNPAVLAASVLAGDQAADPSAIVKPRARPRISVPNSMSLLSNQSVGVTEVGAIAIDANFREFGDYLQRMYEAIGIKWHELNRYGQGTVAENQSSVLVEFYVTAEGQIEDLNVVKSTARNIAEWRCLDAIKGPAPYHPWTKEMTATLGLRQRVRIGFYYR